MLLALRASGRVCFQLLRQPRRVLAGSLAVIALVSVAGCSSGQGQREVDSRGMTACGPRPPRAVLEEDEDAPRPVPPDPYKSFRYRGGRDPGSGVAPGLDGNSPAASRTRQQPAAAPAGPGKSSIVVAQGDTLYAIAARHRVSVAALMQANNLQGPTIVPGQRLTLP